MAVSKFVTSPGTGEDGKSGGQHTRMVSADACDMEYRARHNCYMAGKLRDPGRNGSSYDDR